ncbi:hypothetical protein FFLO_01362 [Filobasidium floriforme]|uniref:Probable RNA-binding protein 18 n=1 Tax=Filobasidium floriforme TaxID=5210 RepID=A0A8K0NUY2_9TREE|nr:hypothetical protein FFLO_01362 [Filobasidium floriforme]
MSYLTTVTPTSTAMASASSSSSTPAASAQRTAPIDPCRLFIGNLSPTVDEYTLIQVFSKCGKVAKMDYLFHKTGPLKGKPRGYAFVEYTNKEDAQKALTKLHTRLLRGRNLVVTQASASPVYDQSKPYRRPGDNANRSTTLSLLKKQGRPQSTNAQIAALEAKIASMQNSPLSAPASAPGSASGSPGPGSSQGERMELDNTGEGGEGWKSLLDGTELEQDFIPVGGDGEGVADAGAVGVGPGEVESGTRNDLKDSVKGKADNDTSKGKGKATEKLHPSLPAKPAAPVGQQPGSGYGHDARPGSGFGQGQGFGMSQGRGQGQGHIVGGGSGGRRGRS